MGKLLVACEESQVVCKAFRALGVEAYSCDILDCSGGHPEWHIKGCAEKEAHSGKYQMMIAHPPCTYLSKAGARWMHPRAGEVCQVRLGKAMQAFDFFHSLLGAPIPHIAVENPTPLKVVGLPKYSQVIQPYEYGHPYSKRTLLWLRGLPPLRSTKVLTEWVPFLPSNTGGPGKSSPGVVSGGKDASVTFSGIAAAMAAQWSKFLKE